MHNFLQRTILLLTLLLPVAGLTGCDAAADDAAAGLEAAHALKGVSGNLSMTKLYELTARQCELIRADDWPAARALVPEVRAVYDRLVAAIEACGR